MPLLYILIGLILIGVFAYLREGLTHTGKFKFKFTKPTIEYPPQQPRIPPDLLAYGTQFFGSEARFLNWYNAPSREFGNRPPADFDRTELFEFFKSFKHF